MCSFTTPSPSSYNIISDFTPNRFRSAAYSFGKADHRSMKAMDNLFPGPGSYNLIGFTGNSQKYTIRSKRPGN